MWRRVGAGVVVAIGLLGSTGCAATGNSATPSADEAAPTADVAAQGAGAP